jgi:hypothetical protein
MASGCSEQCENGYKIKKEYLFWHDSWHESSKDTILDGAVRTSTWTFKDARSVDIRCFEPRSGDPRYDIRYSIDVPLLKRLAPDLEKAGAVELVVSIDGLFVESVPVSVVPQESSLDFLGAIPPTLIDKLENAKETVVVMPRQNEQKLDEVIEFRVAGFRENIEPVKKACATIHSPAGPLSPDGPLESKRVEEVTP